MNRFHRFLFSCVALAALAVGRPVRAEAPQVKTQPPGFYRIMVGQVEVTALLDENSPWPEMLEELFPKLDAKAKTELRARTLMPTSIDFTTSAFLINTGSRLILVDTGGGKQGTYGKLFPNLQAAGYRPEQVDDILITHMHPDHIGGLSEGDARLFPNATVHADQRELPQWQAAAEKGSAAGKRILAKLAPYQKAERFKTFNGATNLFPGIQAIPTYGHTDGHTFYSVESQGQKLVLWGDFLINDKVQLDQVDIAPPGEKDAAAGVALHRKVYTEAAEKGTLIGAAHVSFPGLGRLRAVEGRYIWVPVDYALIRGKGPIAP